MRKALSAAVHVAGLAVLTYCFLTDPARVSQATTTTSGQAKLHLTPHAATGGPQPAVGLYWIETGDPTTGAGVNAPMWQLLFRIDNDTLYYKSGPANTAWTPFEGAGGGTVTAITCGAGLLCTPNPITTTGTIASSLPSTANLYQGTSATGVAKASNETDNGTTFGAGASFLVTLATGAVSEGPATINGAANLTGNQINNLAAGVANTDAVNVSQLNSSIDTGLPSTANLYQGTSTAGVAKASNETDNGTVFGAGTHFAVTLATGSASAPGGLTTNGTSPSGAGDLESTTAKISTTANLAGQFQCSDINAVSLGTSPQNNYNPTNLATTCRLDVTATIATVAITGIAAQPTGTVLVIESDCANGANVVQLNNLSGSSSSANQFDLGATWVLPACSVMTVQYTGANWRAVGWEGTETPPLIIGGALSLTGELLYATPQTNTTTGSQNDVTLNNTTVELIYNGAGSATYTGLTGGASGRFLIITNETTNPLTLSNLNASSAAQHQFQNFGNVDATLVGKTSAAIYMYIGAVNWQMVALITEQNGQPMTFTNSVNRGTVVSGGTATVTAGSICTCADTGAATSCEVSLSSTTLTVTGTAAHNYNYLCF